MSARYIDNAHLTSELTHTVHCGMRRQTADTGHNSLPARRCITWPRPASEPNKGEQGGHR